MGSSKLDISLGLDSKKRKANLSKGKKSARIVPKAGDKKKKAIVKRVRKLAEPVTVAVVIDDKVIDEVAVAEPVLTNSI